MPKPTKDNQRNAGETKTKRSERPVSREKKTTDAGAKGVKRRGSGESQNRAGYQRASAGLNETPANPQTYHATYGMDYWDEDHLDHVYGEGTEGKYYRLGPGKQNRSVARNEKTKRNDPFLDGFNNGAEALRKRKK